MSLNVRGLHGWRGGANFFINSLRKVPNEWCEGVGGRRGGGGGGQGSGEVAD